MEKLEEKKSNYLNIEKEGIYLNWKTLIAFLFTIITTTAGTSFFLGNKVNRINDNHTINTLNHNPTIQKSNKKSNLILLGSGTVCQYIRKLAEEKIKESNIDLFSGPSLAAIKILIDKDLDGLPSSDFIALSSSRIEEDSIMNIDKWNSFQDTEYKKIVALKIGEDKLKIGVHLEQANCFQSIMGDHVRDTLLLSIIKQSNNSDYNIYKTSDQSGTVREFNKLFKKIDSNFSWPSSIKYYEESMTYTDKIMKSTIPSIILCSENYYLYGPQLFDIEDSNYQMAKRDLYLYFSVTKEEYQESNHNYKIEGAKGDFINYLKSKLHNKNFEGPIEINDIPGKKIIETELVELK